MQDTLATWQSELSQAVGMYYDCEPPPLVFGDGKTHEPKLMLIGEAPGEQEARQGKPFVGKAGKNLTAFLNAIDLSREALYVTNVVKIRPSRVSKAGRIVNRPPNRAEIALFTPWLMREVALIRPQVLVTLGNVALSAFLTAGERIGQCHGQWHQVQIKTQHEGVLCLPLFALYHPAAVIYDRALADVYQTDLARLSISLQNGEQKDI